MMKNKIILALMAVVFAFIGCSKDEGDGIPNGGSGDIGSSDFFVGGWVVTAEYNLNRNDEWVLDMTWAGDVYLFTEDEVTSYATGDLFYDEAFSYSYNPEKQELVVWAGMVYKVNRLNSMEIEISRTSSNKAIWRKIVHDDAPSALLGKWEPVAEYYWHSDGWYTYGSPGDRIYEFKSNDQVIVYDKDGVKIAEDAFGYQAAPEQTPFGSYSRITFFEGGSGFISKLSSTEAEMISPSNNFGSSYRKTVYWKID